MAPSGSIVLAKREANAKSLLVRAPVTEIKQHVRPYTQSVTDELFLMIFSFVLLWTGTG